MGGWPSPAGGDPSCTPTTRRALVAPGTSILRALSLRSSISRAIPRLPEPVLGKLLAVRDGRNLRALGRRTVDVTRLRTLTADDVAVLLADQAAGSSWDEDRARIRQTFPEENVGDAVNPGDRRALYHLVAGLKPTRILELGTNIGGSTLVLAQALASHGRDGSSVTTVDILDVNDRGAATDAGLRQAKTPQEHLARLGLDGIVKFVTGSSLEFMGATDERFDLVFVDGDHAATAVYEDVAAATRVLADDGVILLHDFFPDGRQVYPSGLVIAGPYLALERIRAEHDRVVVLPLGDLPWETKLGSKMTTLAIVTTRNQAG